MVLVIHETARIYGSQTRWQLYTTYGAFSGKPVMLWDLSECSALCSQRALLSNLEISLIPMTKEIGLIHRQQKPRDKQDSTQNGSYGTRGVICDWSEGFIMSHWCIVSTSNWRRWFTESRAFDDAGSTYTVQQRDWKQNNYMISSWQLTIRCGLL